MPKWAANAVADVTDWWDQRSTMVTSAGVPRDGDVKVLLNVVSNTLKKKEKTLSSWVYDKTEWSTKCLNTLTWTTTFIKIQSYIFAVWLMPFNSLRITAVYYTDYIMIVNTRKQVCLIYLLVL